MNATPPPRLSKRLLLGRFWKHGLMLAGTVIVLASVYLWYLSSNKNNRNHPNTSAYSPEEIERNTVQANSYFETHFDEWLRMDPDLKAYLGIQDDQAGEWTPLDEAHAERRLAFLQNSLRYVQDSLPEAEGMDGQAALSRRLLEYQLQREIEMQRYRHYTYLVHSMRGVHTSMVTILQTMHRINNEADVSDFLKRLSGVPARIEQLIEQLKLREGKGLGLPRVQYAKVIETTENLCRDTSVRAHPVYETLRSKLDSLPQLTDNQKQAYLQLCAEKLQQDFLPAYRRLAQHLRQAEARAPQEIGVWRMPQGEEYYAWLVKYVTTTDISPEAVFELGQKQIAELHEQMRAIMLKVRFEGNLQEFFKYMRDSDTFYYANTAEGKAAYLADTRQIIERMRPKLPELFNVLPKAALEVRPVEAYQEKSAGKAYYNRGAADGSRPGIYYVNTYDMRQIPNYQMEALAYHEAIPGHHMQLSIAQELEQLPRFRRYGDYTAYIEGWGLYAELLGKELGFYQDPYSDFGRLAMELWRACRLVVDVGIHLKHWTREQAIDFYKENTPNPEIDCINMVDRHIAMPGQAVSYKVGMTTLLELREKAQKRLGSRFDLRRFHDIVLQNGALPLSVLEDLIDDWK